MHDRQGLLWTTTLVLSRFHSIILIGMNVGLRTGLFTLGRCDESNRIMILELPSNYVQGITTSLPRGYLFSPNCSSTISHSMTILPPHHKAQGHPDHIFPINIHLKPPGCQYPHSPQLRHPNPLSRSAPAQHPRSRHPNLESTFHAL